MLNEKTKQLEVVWITNVSTSIGAVVGGLWFYLLRGYQCPKKVYLLHTGERIKENTNLAKKIIEWLNMTFCDGAFEVELWETKDDYKTYNKDLGNILALNAKNADALLLDFTPGRKYMAISMFKYLIDIQHAISRKTGVFKDAKFRDARILNLFLTKYDEFYEGNYLLTDFPIWAYDFLFSKNVLGDSITINRTNKWYRGDSSEYQMVITRYKLMNLLNVFAYMKCMEADDFNACREKNKAVFTFSSHHYEKPFLEFELNLNSDEVWVKLFQPKIKWDDTYKIEVGKFNCERGSQEDIWNILIMSNIRQPSKYNEIIEKIEEFNKRKTIKGAKPGAIAFDTNAFKYQIPYTISRYIEQKEIQNTSILLLNPVKAEISTILDKFKETKYKKEEIPILAKLFRADKHEIEEAYLNIECKERRYWWLASQLFKHLEGKNYATKIGNYERGDDAILNAITKYQNENKKEVVLVTFDGELADRATSKDINTILLQHREAPNKKIKTKWWNTLETIYYASVIFAQTKIKYQSKTITIHGFWRQKDRQNPYNEDPVLIKTKNKDIGNIAKGIIHPFKITLRNKKQLNK